MTYHFINLSNGIFAIKEYNLTDYRVLRIQSSQCEQKLFGTIIQGLSDEFLFRAALGDELIVYDYGAKKKVPRAIWQGLEFIKYVLHKRWKNEEYTPIYRDGNMLKVYYETEYKKLDRPTKHKIDYYRKYFKGTIDIKAVTKSTELDGNLEALLEGLNMNTKTQMATYEQALEYATEMHKGQKRILGEDYIIHPIGVSARCKTLRAKIVALFHDLLEDTKATYDRIFELTGRDQEMMEAIKLITRDGDETYKEFIQRIKDSKNPLAIEVKIADLQDNLSTVDKLPPEKRTLKNRYLAALVELQGE